MKEGRWYKNCINMYVNAKLRTVETIPGIGGRGEE
jgi:hypothetical protein